MSGAEWIKVKNAKGHLAIKAGGSSGRELFVAQSLNYVTTLSLSNEKFPVQQFSVRNNVSL